MADQAAQLLSPTRRRTSGEELKESMEFESTSTQNAPGGGIKETRSEHQDDSMDNDDPFNPLFDDEPVNLTPSPIETALNVTERNLPFLNQMNVAIVGPCL